MPRPTPAKENLRYWKARNRWLYSPIKTEHYPHGGDRDLPGMLRGLADTDVRNRVHLLETVRDLDFAMHDEHEQTLRSLADTPIPGLDSLSFPRD